MNPSIISERTECEAIKRQIDLLQRFYLVSGDEYNTAEISMRYSLDKSLMPEEIFIYDSVSNLGKKWFYEKSIKPTFERIEKPIVRLGELMEWNRKNKNCLQLIFKTCIKTEVLHLYLILKHKENSHESDSM